MNFKKFLFIFTVLMVEIVGITNVNAADLKEQYTYNDVNYSACSNYEFNTKYYAKYAGTTSTLYDDRFTILYATKPSTKIIYCIEKGVSLNTGKKTYSKSAQVSSDTEKGNIAKAIRYGGQYGGSSVKSCTYGDSRDRMVTTLLVHMISKNDKWKTVSEATIESIITEVNNSRTTSAQDAFAKSFISLRNKVKNYYSKLNYYSSLSSAKENAKMMKYNSKTKKFTLELTNDTLKSDTAWGIYKKDSGLTASVSGNKLKVEADLDQKGKKLCLTFRKKRLNGQLYLHTSSGQDSVFLTKTDDTYVYSYVCFKSSYIEITKVDAANKTKTLSGATFNIYTDSNCKNIAQSANGVKYDDNVETGSSGKVYYFNMKNGEYYVKETAPPNKYRKDTNVCRKVVVSDGKGTVTFENNKIKSTDIQVLKKDKYENRPLSGVKIGLYEDSECKNLSKLVSESERVKTTGDDGTVYWDNIEVTGMNSLTLYVKEEEKNNLPGYIQDNSCKKVRVSSSDIVEGETAEIENSTTIYNVPYGNISILKLDDDTRKPLENVTFRILDEDKKEVFDINKKKVEPAATNKNGVVTFKDLYYGVYYIEEVNENPKYKTFEPYLFELNENTDSIKLADLAAIRYYVADVNLDHKIDETDLDSLNTMIKNNEVIGLEKEKLYSSDVNHDSIINEDDVAMLKFYLDNKSSVDSYKSAEETLCKGQEECELNNEEMREELININKITTLDNKTSSQICYAPATPAPTAESGDTPNGTTPEEGGTEPPVVEPDEEDPTPNGGGGVNNPSSPPTCHFNETSLTYLSKYITDNTTQGLSADFNGDSKVDKKDAAILEQYLSHVKNETIDEVSNYVTLLDKIKDIGITAIPILKTIGDYKTIPSNEVHASIVIVNIPIDMRISKLDIISSEEVPGAQIVIKDSQGKEVIKYVSTNEPKEFYISAGEYTLTETIPPQGYLPVETVLKFRVKSDGSIELIDNNSNLFEIVNSNDEKDTDLDHLIIYNKSIIPDEEKKTIIKVPNTGSKVAFATLVVGIALVGTGGYFVYNRYKKGEVS